jgi:acid phosphatase
MSSRLGQSGPYPQKLGRIPKALKVVFAAIIVVAAMSVVTAISDAAVLSVPDRADPGSTIAVSGWGFGGGQIGELTYNGSVVAQFQASSTGTFTVPVTIPNDAPPGTGRISAKGTQSEVLTTVTLGIGNGVALESALSVPATAAPGSTVIVSGSGFLAGQVGNLTYNGRIVVSFAAAADGSFSQPFAIPTDATIGTGRISARAIDRTLLATATLEIAAGAGSTPVPTPTGQPVATATPAASDTASPSSSPGDTPTPAPSSSPGATPTVVPVPTFGPTPLPTLPPAPTPTPSPRATPAPTPAPTPPPNPTPSPVLPNFSHVYVIVMENHEYSSIVGSSSAPYINSLISQYGVATSYYAVSHPSEPNYLALTSGGTQGVTDDGNYDLAVNNLFDQIDASGRTWRSYEQGYPGGCYAGSSAAATVDGPGQAGSYVRKHDPAISYTSISGNGARCANITNLAAFNPAATNFAFIVPNLINDMHDGSIATGDSFLRAFLPQITTSPSFANSVVFLTFDEGSSNANGGGHVVTIAITGDMTAGYQAPTFYSHYSMLHTIEQAWGLPYLGNSASASAMAFPY